MPPKPRAAENLTARQKLFIEHYAELRNALEASRRANYSVERGRLLLRRPYVIALLKEKGVEIQYGLNPPGQKRSTPGLYSPRAPKPLTQLQQRFIQEYLIDGNGTKAAIRAGLPGKTPSSAATKMLRRKPVAAVIEREREIAMERTRITRDRVLLEYARIAFAEIGDIADWDESAFVMKPKDAIAKDDRAAVAEIRSKSGKKGTRTEIRLHSKLGALDALAKHLGLWGKRSHMETLEEKCKIDGRDPREVLRERFLRALSAPAGELATQAFVKKQEAQEEGE